MARLSDIIRWVYAARISQRSTRSWDEHAAILVAVAAGDVEAARRCGEDHIAAAAAAYQSTEPVERDDVALARQKPRTAPPSTRIAVPVTKEARAEHRNVTTSASSLAAPKRPRGIAATCSARTSPADILRRPPWPPRSDRVPACRTGR